MYPTIENGDRVTVKLGVSASLISEGDIIVYGTIVALSYNPNPDSMFIGHRVIEKYEDRGTLYFKTQGDNCPEPDPYTVPDYFVVGIVVNINSPSTPAGDTSEPSENPSPQPSTYIGGVPIWAWLGGGSLALIVAVGAVFHFKGRWEPEVHMRSLELPKPRDCTPLFFNFDPRPYLLILYGLIFVVGGLGGALLYSRPRDVGMYMFLIIIGAVATIIGFLGLPAKQRLYIRSLLSKVRIARNPSVYCVDCGSYVGKWRVGLTRQDGKLCVRHEPRFSEGLCLRKGQLIFDGFRQRLCENFRRRANARALHYRTFSARWRRPSTS